MGIHGLHKLQSVPLLLSKAAVTKLYTIGFGLACL